MHGPFCSIGAACYARSGVCTTVRGDDQSGLERYTKMPVVEEECPIVPRCEISKGIGTGLVAPRSCIAIFA